MLAPKNRGIYRDVGILHFAELLLRWPSGYRHKNSIYILLAMTVLRSSLYLTWSLSLSVSLSLSLPPPSFPRLFITFAILSAHLWDDREKPRIKGPSRALLSSVVVIAKPFTYPELALWRSCSLAHRRRWVITRVGAQHTESCRCCTSLRRSRRNAVQLTRTVGWLDSWWTQLKCITSPMFL